MPASTTENGAVPFTTFGFFKMMMPGYYAFDGVIGIASSKESKLQGSSRMFGNFTSIIGLVRFFCRGDAYFNLLRNQQTNRVAVDMRAR